jgi:ABC-2 type transport system ATP-binding protein
MIELTKVTKKFGSTRTSTTAINGISLTIREHGIYCLLGRNGAGKTTLMKLLSGYIAATDGQIIVDGNRVSPHHMPEDVSYITSGAEQFNMHVSQLIDAAAELQEDFDRGFAEEMVERFELDTKKKFKQLSLGLKSMLTSSISLANNSKVILMDEPTLGFDAVMRDQFNTLLLESYHNHPRIIIVSTHLIDEIAKVTEKIIIINKGRILLEAGIDEIDEKAYTLSCPTQTILSLLENLNCIGKTAAGSVMAAHMYGDRIVPPDGVTIDRLSLQDFFINIVGGKK